MHLALVVLVVLLVFGPRKLPELARGVGEAMKELKQSLHAREEPEPGAGAEG
jgi:sec-independent protein translocase protein TatA